MRPSKLRLPLSTDATTRSFSTTTLDTSCGSGPELPMQWVHPYPPTGNLSFSRYGSSPDRVRSSVTTIEPGASDVFTHLGTVSPLSTAFFSRCHAPPTHDGVEWL